MENAVIYKNGEANDSPISTVASTGEVIRGSVIVMVWQLIIFLIFTDTIYTLINTFLMRVYFLLRKRYTILEIFVPFLSNNHL